MPVVDGFTLLADIAGKAAFGALEQLTGKNDLQQTGGLAVLAPQEESLGYLDAMECDAPRMRGKAGKDSMIKMIGALSGGRGRGEKQLGQLFGS